MRCGGDSYFCTAWLAHWLWGSTTRRQIPSLCQQCKVQTHAMKTGWPGGIPRVVTLLSVWACCCGEWTCIASRAGNESPTLALLTCSIASARDRVVKMCSLNKVPKRRNKLNGTNSASCSVSCGRPSRCVFSLSFLGGWKNQVLAVDSSEFILLALELGREC